MILSESTVLPNLYKYNGNCGIDRAVFSPAYIGVNSSV
jgi:hypothetical protein